MPPIDVADAPRSVRRQERSRRVRQAIRSALAGVALALATASGVGLAAETQYTVVPGDTLIDIATRIGVSTRSLMNVNDIEDADFLRPGQVLRLPVEASDARPSLSSRGVRPADDVLSSVRSSAWVWPLRGVITTYFGEPGALWRRGYHPGLDVAAPIGTTISASAAGVVLEAESSGYNSGYGSYVKVDHGGGLHTLYAHMARVHVSVGDQVEPGDALGTIGMTGLTTGPHLHMEVRRGGDLRDPMRYLP